MWRQRQNILTELAQSGGKGKEALTQKCNELRRQEVLSFGLTEVEYHKWSTHAHSRYKWETSEEHAKRELEMEPISAKLDYDHLFEFELLLHDCWKDTYKLLFPPAKVHAGHELGPREFTLTYSPDWFDDDKAQFFMKQAIERIVKYYEDEIVYLRAVGERTKANRVHIHCYYELKGGVKITDKNMKRAYHKWDSKHHHHKLVRNTSNFKGYIDKEIETAWYSLEIDNRKLEASEIIF